jgi:glycosyltransferase involved in cell wall biosynthesis
MTQHYSMSNLLVSIGIPTRNRAALLELSLRTILAQTYSPIEILISDDGSTDGTEELCRRVAQSDSRVRYVRQSKPLGCYANHNFCINETRGEFLCLFHDDDQHHPDLIKECAGFLLRHPEVGLVCSDWDLLDEEGVVVGTRVHHVPEILDGLEFIGRTIRAGQSSIGIPGAMIRRSALGSWRLREDGPLGYADFVLWFQISEGAAVGHIPRRLWQYRLVGQSIGHRTVESMVHDYDDQMSRYCDGHLQRFPHHADLVARWRRDVKRYIFWALLYALGLHFRSRHVSLQTPVYQKTVFELRECGLSQEELKKVVTLLHVYCPGVPEKLILATVNALMRFRFTKPLAWATFRHDTFRSIFGLR